MSGRDNQIGGSAVDMTSIAWSSGEFQGGENKKKMTSSKVRSLLTNDDRDTIKLLFEKGLSTQQIMLITGKSKTAVQHVRRAYSYVSEGQIERLRNTEAYRNNRHLMLWACDRAGVDYEDLMKKIQSPPIDDTPDTETPDSNHSLPNLKPDAKQHEQTRKELSAIRGDITALGRVIIELRQEMYEEIHGLYLSNQSLLQVIVKKLDQMATIIQSCSAGEIKKMDQLREESNANWDNLHTMIKDQSTNLEYIRKNTRPNKAPKEGIQ